MILTSIMVYVNKFIFILANFGVFFTIKGGFEIGEPEPFIVASIGTLLFMGALQKLIALEDESD